MISQRSNMKRILRKISILTLVAIIAGVHSLPTYAASDFFSDSDIQLYNPEACDPNTGGQTQEKSSETPAGTGKWSIQPGVPTNLTEDFKKFMDQVATHTSYEPIATTTTNHDKFTSSGNISDHYTGNAADFGSVLNKFGTNTAKPGAANKRGDELAAAALIAAGIEPSKAKRMALEGGLYNENTTIDGKPFRIQVIWKASGHYDHVHIGVKPLSVAKKDQKDDSFLDWFSSQFSSETVTAAELQYVAKGNIPKKGKKIIASVYGTNGKKDADGKYVEELGGMEGGPKDEQGKALAGRAVVAEMGGNTALGSLPYGSKIEITYKGKSIIAEVSDNGPGAGEHSDIDLWRQTADLLDFPYDKEEVFVRGVPNSTPTTPVDGSASDANPIENDEVNSCCPANGGNKTISSTEEGLVGDNNAEKAFNFFIREGLSKEQAAGIVGNMMAESGGQTFNIEPTLAYGGRKVKDPSGLGVPWGIVQWNPGSKVLDAKSEYNVKGEIDDLGTQLKIVLEQLKGTAPTGLKNIIKDLKKINSVGEATAFFEEKFEGAQGQASAQRKQNAEKALQEFGSGATPSSPAGGSSQPMCVCNDPNATTSVNGANPKNLSEFVKQFADAALAAGKKYGVPYDFILAQIAHESGLPLSELAAQYNNFGGIKFTGEGKATPPMRTYEEDQGYIMARFRAYDTPQEGLEQQAKFFIDNSRYSKALNYPRNPDRFAEEVAKAGYATDSSYAQKVKAMIKQVQDELIKLGKPLSKDVVPDAAPAGGDRSDEPLTTADCGGNVGSPTVIDGFAFPVGNLKKSEVGTNNGMPCTDLTGGCHHDGTSAFDIGKASGTDHILGMQSKGLPVYAIEDGEIVNYNSTYRGFPNCPNYQLKGKSGWVYWYGHTANASVKMGSKVKVGQKIAEIGPSVCTGMGVSNPPHLHIDRGKPKEAFGGRMEARDPSINELMNKLWEGLPQ